MGMGMGIDVSVGISVGGAVRRIRNVVRLFRGDGGTARFGTRLDGRVARRIVVRHTDLHRVLDGQPVDGGFHDRRVVDGSFSGGGDGRFDGGRFSDDGRFVHGRSLDRLLDVGRGVGAPPADRFPVAWFPVAWFPGVQLVGLRPGGLRPGVRLLSDPLGTARRLVRLHAFRLAIRLCTVQCCDVRLCTVRLVVRLCPARLYRVPLPGIPLSGVEVNPSRRPFVRLLRVR
jgi:hypothetical protein